MISFLNGQIVERRDSVVVVDVNGVGYEVYCSPSVGATLGDLGSPARVFVFSHYKTDGVSLYGFSSSEEKQLFLNLIKVDTVGPKSAMTILHGAPWPELVELIDDGDAAALAKLPKITKKLADHLVVKLKGKLGELRLALHSQPAVVGAATASPGRVRRGRRDEVQSILTNLGYRLNDVSKILDGFEDDIWSEDTENVIRKALAQMSGAL